MLHEVASGPYNQVAWVLAGYQVNTLRYFWASWLLQQYFWITPISVTSGEGRNGLWYGEKNPLKSHVDCTNVNMTKEMVFKVVKVSKIWLYAMIPTKLLPLSQAYDQYCNECKVSVTLTPPGAYADLAPGLPFIHNDYEQITGVKRTFRVTHWNVDHTN